MSNNVIRITDSLTLNDSISVASSKAAYLLKKDTDSKVSKSGDTVTGNLVIDGDLHVAGKINATIEGSTESATTALKDSAGNIIVDTYATKGELGTVDNKIPGINSRVTDLETRLPLVENTVATGSTTARTLQDRFADVVNVQDFGAVGDGVTDDTDAIQAAIQAAKEYHGKTVIFPSGKYLHRGIHLIEARSVTLRGDTKGAFASSMDGTHLIYAGSGNHIELSNCFGCELEGFVMYPEESSTGNYAISIFGSHGASAYCRVKDIRLENVVQGVCIDGVSNSELRDIYIIRCSGSEAVSLKATSKRLDQIRVENVGIDCDIEGGSDICTGFSVDNDVHTVWFKDCFALKCKTGFLLGNGCHFVRVLNSDAENCKEHGFKINNATFPWLQNVYATANKGVGIEFSSDFAGNAHLNSPDARGNSLHGILIDGSNGITILSPVIGGNGNTGITLGKNVSNVTIIGGKIGGDVTLSDTSMQNVGIDITQGNGDNIAIVGVDLRNNSTLIAKNASGSNIFIEANVGVNRRFRGIIKIKAGNTTGSTLHNMGFVPTNVKVTPLNKVQDFWWVNKTTTEIVVALGSAPSDDVIFDVEAIIE